MDARTLAAAFKGVEGVFVRLPPNFDPTPGFPEARMMAAAVRSALEAAPPAKVLFLSTIGAQATRPNLLTLLTMMAQDLVRFSGGIGDITTGSTSTTVRGVPAAGQIWVIHDLAADVKQGGSIRIDGRGLLLGAGDAIGSNGNASVFATLFCSNDGNVQHSSNPAGVALEVNGDFRIDDTLSPAPPNQCGNPVLLIRVTGPGSWFAAGIPRQ